MVEKWPKDHWKKKKEILFPGSYDNVKINESTKAFRLIDDQCSWVTINLTALTILPLDISRGSHPCKHTALLPAPVRRRAGHGSVSARARGAPPCKKYNLERGNRPSIQLPTPSPIISFITWMLHQTFGFETLRRLLWTPWLTLRGMLNIYVFHCKTDFNIRFKIHQILKHSPLHSFLSGDLLLLH